MSYEIRALTKPMLGGEGPHWDHGQQALYFVDILRKSIHKFKFETETLTHAKLDEAASFIIPVEGKRDQFVVGAGRKVLQIRWDGEEGSSVEVVRELGEVDRHKPRNRMNDGKADPRGRLFTGTLNWGSSLQSIERNEGSLYRISSVAGGAPSVQAVDDQITVANGLAWDLKERAFYYIDSLEYRIRRYDYDVETGNISNKSYIFDIREHGFEGVPDGMTIDTDGNIWVAVHDSSYVLKIDPRTGNLLEKILMPVKGITSVTFGGPNLDVLFVTSLSYSPDGELPSPAGATFMVTGLGVQSQPNVSFKI